MAGLAPLEALYIGCAFGFHTALLVHFALRRWRFAQAVRHGWWVYALSVPAAAASALLFANGRPWWLWLGGLLYLLWAGLGYAVEYLRPTEWRAPVRWPIFVPYIGLYLATTMFYWWPLARVWRPLWYVATVFFAANTYLNITSHRRPTPTAQH